MKRFFNFIIGCIVLVLLVVALVSVGTIVVGVLTALCIIAGFVAMFKRKPKTHVTVIK